MVCSASHLTCMTCPLFKARTRTIIHKQTRFRDTLNRPSTNRFSLIHSHMSPAPKKRKGADGSAIRCPPVEEDPRTSPAKCQVLTPPSSSNSDDSDAPPPGRIRRAPRSPAKCQVLTPRSSTSSSDDSDAPPVPGPRRIRRAPPSLDDFTILRRIGQGNYGKVHLGE